MYKNLFRLAAVALALALTACGSSEDEEATAAAPAEPRTASIRGTLTYVGDHILAPESTIKIELIDVSQADAKATVVADTVLQKIGQPPLPYELRYDMNQIEPGKHYALRANVMEQKRLMFISDQAYPVLRDERQGPVDILLKYVPGGHLDRMPERVRANNPELTGVYRYFKDGGEFRDCSDDSVHPVASEKGVFELESEYRDVAPRFGDEVFVRVAGKYETRPARSGRGKEDYLVVMQVEEMDASGDCPP
ncbi:MAG: YbaY family lipoprotein [Xanthomonadales bacterium]|nr:YbaY family lipoprotein [Xanthomonadales bacterium]